MARLTIDGKQLEVADGTRLFDACTQARGEPLPHFCYHPDLPIAGVCRLCQVEIEGMPKLTIACNTIVKDGMVVSTRSEKVREAARKILELHLINHPVDCPICDQAGECGLQDQYMEYGLYDAKVSKADKVQKQKAEVIGPHVILDKERCVLCDRCVRFCREVTKTGELGIFNRGDRAEIGVAPGSELNNNYSLNTVDICPVGALTSRDFRFQKRVWLLRSTVSLCPGCATGCNVRLDHEAGRVWRIKPRRNDEVNGPWMCDIGRMTYKALHDEKRLQTPLLRRDGEQQPGAWHEFWPRLQQLLAPGQVSLAVANPHQTLEELMLWRWLFGELAGQDSLIGGLTQSQQASADELLLDSDRSPNRCALEWLQLPLLGATDMVRRLTAADKTIVIYGADPVSEDPALAAALAGCQRLVYFGTHLSATARTATMVVPLLMWAEKDGIFVNRQGRLQRFARAIAGPGEAQEDWRFLAELCGRLGGRQAPASLTALRRLAASELALEPEVDLCALPETGCVPQKVSGRVLGGAN
jgi:NADH-quinone oxidoreductase subunit G